MGLDVIWRNESGDEVARFDDTRDTFIRAVILVGANLSRAVAAAERQIR